MQSTLNCRRRITISATCAVLAAIGPARPAIADDLFTSFELFDTSGEFTLGEPPMTVTFTGGLAQSVFDPSLYISGLNAWMIPPGATGTVSFETPAEHVNFWFRDQFASVNSVLNVLDANGNLIESINGSTQWNNVVITIDPQTQVPIGQITLSHNGSSGWTVMDAFSFCAMESMGSGVLEFVMTIDGTQEAPPVQTDGSGAGTATLDLATNLFSWEITFENLSSPETAAHFHGPAPHCENAGIEVPLPLGSPKVGSATLTNQQVEDLMLGLWYVNIHSANFPSGEIRGQVVPPPLLDPLPPIAQGAVHIVLEPLADGLTAPLFGAENPADPTRLFVPDQDGVLWAIDLETGDKTVFLDVTDRIVSVGVFGPNTFDERGLLGVAFHPDYARNGLLYTYTSEPLNGPADFSTMPTGTFADHQSVIVEWQVPDPTNPAAAPDPNSARVLLRIDQPQFNHNGGALAFGPDGMLYISIGDGGGADDVDGQPSLGVPMIGHGCLGNGQDPSNPLGAILRIDPLGSNSANGQYGIPANNPFVGHLNFLDENFAYGLRNPWRMSFDSLTGEFYVADVGQNDIEEINIVNPGDNLGWNHKEGSFYFIRNGAEPGYITDREQAAPGGVTGFVDPIAEYHNPTDGIAIIGGFVYRGGKIGPLEGRYVFGDWSMSFGAPSGRLFYLTDDNEPVEFAFVGDEPFEAFVLGFGQDADGELYVMTNQTGTPFGDTGAVYRIRTLTGDLDANGVVGVPDLLILLAQWGPCTPGESCPADLDGDGNVGVPDLLMLLANWG